MDQELKQYLHEMRAEMLSIEKRIIERVKLHIEATAEKTRAAFTAESLSEHSHDFETMTKNFEYTETLTAQIAALTKRVEALEKQVGGAK